MSGGYAFVRGDTMCKRVLRYGSSHSLWAEQVMPYLEQALESWVGLFPP